MISISKSVQLETITTNHHDKLYGLVSRIYPPVYKHLWLHEDCDFYFDTFFSKKNLLKELQEAHTVYYFVVYNSKTVGILRVNFNRPFPENPNKKSTYLNRIYLGQEAQGKGVAKALFNWIEAQSKIKRNELIWLKAMDTQTQALKFYEKQDFIKSGKIELDFELIHKHLRGMYTMYKLI